MECFTDLHVILAQGPSYSLSHSNFNIFIAKAGTAIFFIVCVCVFFKDTNE